MLLLGALIGILDVVMNAHAVAVEAALGRPVMNSCHAAWSLGAVAGSLIGGAAAQADVSLTSHYLGLSVVLVAVALVAGRWLLPSAADRTPRPVQDDSRPDGQLSRWAAGWRAGWRAGWTRRLLVLGAMGATILTCEAAVANWSGVLLHEHLGASLGVASLGYFVFTGCETAGRLVGDRLTARYCAAVLIRLGTAIAAGGLTLVVLSPTPALAVIGFAVMGLGLATPLPVLFSVVGHLGGASGPGAAVFVARFSTMTYSGILLGPALIGLVAGLIGLGWTLAALVPPLLGVALFGAAAAPDQLAATE